MLCYVMKGLVRSWTPDFPNEKLSGKIFSNSVIHHKRMKQPVFWCAKSRTSGTQVWVLSR